MTQPNPRAVMGYNVFDPNRGVRGKIAPSSVAAVEQIRTFAVERALEFRCNELSGDGAVFSPCGRWRYLLWRSAFVGAPFMAFAMLNPSTATEEQDDPTIKRCRSWAARSGLGGPLVCNIFAYRATKPADMKAAEDPVGPDNDAAIDLALRLSAVTVAAWGVHGALFQRDHAVRRRCAAAGEKLHALAFTKDGHPRHPLYVAGAVEPSSWDFDW